jgi:hypothetical protein
MKVAEKERFELSMEVSPHTRLAGERLQPLGHFSVRLSGGGGRIRTHEAVTLNGFQDRRLQPLGHSSMDLNIRLYHFAENRSTLNSVFLNIILLLTPGVVALY